VDIPEIDVDQLAGLHAAGVQILDVREDDEVAAARVRGAQHIPLGDLIERVDEVPDDGTVYVICARGARSARAVEHLLRQGYDAVNVAGGIIAWIDAGHPTELGPASGAGGA
jgi:rhodanese-related sulfurtransferase